MLIITGNSDSITSNDLTSLLRLVPHISYGKELLQSLAALIAQHLEKFVCAQSKYQHKNRFCSYGFFADADWPDTTSVAERNSYTEQLIAMIPPRIACNAFGIAPAGVVTAGCTN